MPIHTHKNTYIRRQVLEILYAYDILLGSNLENYPTKDQIITDYEEEKFKLVCDFSSLQGDLDFELGEDAILEEEMQKNLESFDEDEITLANIEKDAANICENIFSRKSELDKIIDKLSTNWEFNRISIIDRNILRLALFEIQYLDEVPESVAINEAVELAKIFGGEQSYKFVNGILGQFSRNSQESKD